MTIITTEQKGSEKPEDILSEKPEDILKELRFYYTKAILEKIKRLETENSVLQDLVESNKSFISPIIKNGADLEKKLDKAKQIITELVGAISFPNIYGSLINKANNFLKEVDIDLS